MKLNQIQDLKKRFPVRSNGRGNAVQGVLIKEVLASTRKRKKTKKKMPKKTTPAGNKPKTRKIAKEETKSKMKIGKPPRSHRLVGDGETVAEMSSEAGRLRLRRRLLRSCVQIKKKPPGGGPVVSNGSNHGCWSGERRLHDDRRQQVEGGVDLLRGALGRKPGRKEKKLKVNFNGPIAIQLIVLMGL